MFPIIKGMDLISIAEITPIMEKGNVNSHKGEATWKMMLGIYSSRDNTIIVIEIYLKAFSIDSPSIILENYYLKGLQTVFLK